MRRVLDDPLVRVVRLLEVPWGRVLRAALTGTAGLGSAVALTAVSAWLIARASQMPPVMHLTVAAVAVRTFGISRGVLRYLERLLSHDLALRGMARLRERIYDLLAAGRGDTLARLRRGDLLGRVGADVDAVGDVVVRSLLPALVALGVGTVSVVLVGVFLPAAAAALAGCLLLAGVAAPTWAVLAGRAGERDAMAARAETAAVALTALEGAAELTVGGRLDAVLTAMGDADRTHARATDRAARRAALAAACGPLATGLAVVAALLLGIPATVSGGLTPVELAVVVLTPLAAFEAASVLPGAATQALRSRTAAERVLALLDGSGTAGPRAATRPPSGVSRLVAEGLACGWSRDAPLLADVALDLRPGRSVAVVGPSGSGKTTLLLTLAGLLPAAEGTVRVRGADPAALSRGDVAREVALTTEDAHVFDTTVLENLRVARGDVTPAQAEAALAQVGLATWLAGLPDGLGTRLGTDAGRVSGGERRRLLLARALLGPAPLLLLDEPTEHLDADGRALLTALLDGSLAPGRGVLVVTHDVDGAQAADDVIVVGAPSTVRG